MGFLFYIFSSQELCLKVILDCGTSTFIILINCINYKCVTDEFSLKTNTIFIFCFLEVKVMMYFNIILK